LKIDGCEAETRFSKRSRGWSGAAAAMMAASSESLSESGIGAKPASF
jgi:hypothetical protein